jgi:hypothetical protein
MGVQHQLPDAAAARVAARVRTEVQAGERDAAEPPAAEPRSSYGTVPGDEFPPAVYISVVAAFAWVLLASWLAYARDAYAELALGVALVLGIVFFALPIIVWRVATRRSSRGGEPAGDFLSSRVETATGPLTGASAWLQVLLIPATLALAATLIGATSVLVH